MKSVVSKCEMEEGLKKLGIRAGMPLEVHCALGQFGRVEGGAATVIEALMNVLGRDGAIVMPSFRLSENLPLDETDRQLGLVCKIRILPEDAEKTGMGVVSDTFRKRQDVITGKDVFRMSAWGKDAQKHAQGLHHLIEMDGWALLAGVDIYRLSAMHYVEDVLPGAVRERFAVSAEARARYPEGEWLVEAWAPEAKPWYTIQNAAYEKGLIRDGMIGNAKCMLLRVRPVIALYRQALLKDPLGLYGLA